MKEYTGGISRVSLSFDMTFFALVRIALCRSDFGIRKRRCFLHPVNKRPMMDDNEALAYTAYVNAFLVHYKVKDTVADEHGVKRLGAYMLKPYTSRMERRAIRAELKIASIVEDAMAEIASLEADSCGIPDMPADAFGNMLGKLLAFGLDERNSKIAYEIGLHTGRWVYLADAVFDYDDDKKKARYNPFLFAFSDSDQMAQFKTSSLRGIMTMEADAIMRAVDLIDFDGRAMLRSCIENIIYDGMESSLSVAYGKEQTDGE